MGNATSMSAANKIFRQGSNLLHVAENPNYTMHKKGCHTCITHTCNGVAYTGWDSSTSFVISNTVNGITPTTPQAFKRRIKKCPGPLNPEPDPRFDRTNFIQQIALFSIEAPG